MENVGGISLINAQAFWMLSQRSSKNRRAESLHLFPRKLVAIFSAGHERRTEKSVCSPQATGMGNTGRGLLRLAKGFKKRVFNKKLTLN